MNLTKSERETIIIFNEAEPNAEITTASPKWKRRLDQLVAKNAAIQRTSNNEVFSAYILPKKLLSVRQPTVITDEKRLKSLSALASARKKRNQTKNEATDDEKSDKKEGERLTVAR